MGVLLTAQIFALPGVEAQLQLGARTPAPVPYPANHGGPIAREQSRGPHRFKSQPYYYPMGEPGSFLVPHAMGRAPRFSPCKGYER